MDGGLADTARANTTVLIQAVQSVSQLFHGPAPRSPLHRLAVRLRHSRSNTSTEYSLPGATQLSQVNRRSSGEERKTANLGVPSFGARTAPFFPCHCILVVPIGPLLAAATAAAARTRERRGGVSPVSSSWTRFSCASRMPPAPLAECDNAYRRRAMDHCFGPSPAARKPIVWWKFCRSFGVHEPVILEAHRI